MLENRELTVSELCSVLQLPQSTVSRHLKILSDDGWVASRADGTSRLYRLETALEPAPSSCGSLVRDQVADTAAGRQDARRVESVVERAPLAVAGVLLVGRRAMGCRSPRPLRRALTARRHARPSSIPTWRSRDLGCGTGSLTATLAPFVRRVIAVDGSAPMLAAARRRLDGTANVDMRQGELEALPIENAQVDAAVMSLVLHYIAEPAKALGEAARVLRPGGRLLVVDMMPHDREEYRQQMGHVWLGFSPEQLADWLVRSGIRARSLHAAPGGTRCERPRIVRRVGNPRRLD